MQSAVLQQVSNGVHDPARPARRPSRGLGQRPLLRPARLWRTARRRRVAAAAAGPLSVSSPPSATLRYLRPKRATIVIACYRERVPDAWGKPLPIDKACGAPADC